MPRFVAAPNGTFPASDFNSMFGDPPTQDVATAQSTTSTSYTDLATVGPSRSYSLNAGQGCLVIVSARASSSLGGTSGQALFSFAVSGASTLGAADANGVEADVSQGITVTRITWFVATNTGSHTFTMKYRAGTAGTATFADRRLIVVPR